MSAGAGICYAGPGMLRIPMRGYEYDETSDSSGQVVVTNPHEGL